MLVGFKCPDNKEVKFKDCIEKCRLGDRCASLPTLLQMASVREWKGIPSTTQLINGTMNAFLTITVDHYEKVDDLVYRTFGTKAHLDKAFHGDGVEGALLEQKVGDRITGIVDYFFKGLLVDFKTSGYFKLMKYLNGEERYPHDWKLQLNKYRIGLTQLGHEVKQMKNEVTIRDYNRSAERGGMDRKIYYLHVPFVRDKLIERYFSIKRERLLKSLEDGKCTHLCTPLERWWKPKTKEDRKCTKYCTINHHCPYWKEKYG